MVGEAVHGRGKCSRKKVGRTNNDRGKDVVPRERERVCVFMVGRMSFIHLN